MSARKRYKYYNCRNNNCSVKNFNEIDLEEQFLPQLKQIQFSEEEGRKFIEAVKKFRTDMNYTSKDELKAITMEEARIRQQKEGLALRFMEGKIEEETYDSLKERLINQSLEIKRRRNAVDQVDEKILTQIVELGKLLRNPYLAYQKASPENRRRLVKSMVENFSWRGEKVLVNWKNEFKLVAETKNVHLVDLMGPSGNLFIRISELN